MAAEITRSDPIYQLPDHVRSASRADSGVVLDIEHGRMFRLNCVGSRMLELVKSGLQEPEIVARIAEEFAIGFDTAVQDTREFLEKLRQLGVIEERRPGTARSETWA